MEAQQKQSLVKTKGNKGEYDTVFLMTNIRGVPNNPLTPLFFEDVVKEIHFPEEIHFTLLLNPSVLYHIAYCEKQHVNAFVPISPIYRPSLSSLLLSPTSYLTLCIIVFAIQ